MIDKIAKLLFPDHCISCKKYGYMICHECKSKLKPHPYMCPVCHKKSDYFQVCKNCKIWGIDFDGLDIVFYYDKIIKKLLLQMKYYHKYKVVDFFVDKIVLSLKSNQLWDDRSRDKKNVLVTSVPSHRWRRYMIKWYNQSALLASWVAQKLDLEYATIFVKKTHTKTQASLDRKSRLNNLAGAFDLIKGAEDMLHDIDTVLIVDDVTTTGSTINQLARIIKKLYPHISVRWSVVGRNNR